MDKTVQWFESWDIMPHPTVTYMAVRLLDINNKQIGFAAMFSDEYTIH